jgi:hypothetical protein
VETKSVEGKENNMSLSLGSLISILERENPDKVVRNGFRNPHSYRGYYECLAFEPAKDITVREMLVDAKYALNNVFTGYKGGEFRMDEYTDVYIAPYGNTGDEMGRMLLNYMLNDVKERDLYAWIQCQECGWGEQIAIYLIGEDYKDNQACPHCGYGYCKIDRDFFKEGNV